ncbi:MAG: glycogen debranching enzyme family protein [Chloroflexi bacterium]|nr:glycogen debranching enzyme family protein [Chloroflexota bacterium]
MIGYLKRTIPWVDAETADHEQLITREWLVTNGLGGYASGTVSGVISRRYHGLLVAALPSPFGRMVMLNSVLEYVKFADGSIVQITGEERSACALQMRGACFLTDFSLEMGLPVWRYHMNDVVIEKRVLLRYRQNTVQVSYRIFGKTPVQLDLRPCLNFRPHNEPLNGSGNIVYSVVLLDDFYEISRGLGSPVLRMATQGQGASFVASRTTIEGLIYRVEESLGYEGRENLWSPGYFTVHLSPGNEVILIASTESADVLRALSPNESLSAELSRRNMLLGISRPEMKEGPGAEIVLAADQFVVTPVTRQHDTARINARGDEARTVIAGYHWFTDWGRDTMISLEGLTLLTGRYAEAGWILRTFGTHIRDGLIPNMFPEGMEEGRYHTADATLWFFHAVERYLQVTNDRTTLRFLLPKLLGIIECHMRGTRFGIRVDPVDGLLTQGTKDFPLTWMDAKVGDWIVTPRRGKAVEINALWYNALRLAEGWCRLEGKNREADILSQHADQAKESFNRRFWYENGGYLYDVVDGEKGDDPSCRPNQVLAISLPHAVLDRAMWEPVIKVVAEKLLTPVGLRSLAPGSPGYRPTYFGDIRSRDAAYHQGTVWPWLIGPFIDAWLKLHPGDKRGARKLLDGFLPHLNEACIGSISEVFDAEQPFTARGCISQAWSVAEFLRCWFNTADSQP